MSPADYFHVDILVQICQNCTFSKGARTLDFYGFFPCLYFVHGIQTLHRSNTTCPRPQMIQSAVYNFCFELKGRHCNEYNSHTPPYSQVQDTGGYTLLLHPGTLCPSSCCSICAGYLCCPLLLTFDGRR